MTKTDFLRAALLAAVFLISCGGPSAQEKIVGNWESDSEEGVLIFRSDGSVTQGVHEGTWELSGEGPFTLKIYEGDSLEAEASVTFRGDDVMEIDAEGRKMTFKRSAD